MSLKKYDIFSTLHHIDLKNKNVMDTLTHDEQKQLSPFVLMKWLTGTQDQAQIVLMNEFVNPYCFSLQTHKTLLVKLMTICTTGKKKNYKWEKTSTGKKVDPAIEIIKKYYNYNTIQALDVRNMFSEDDLQTMASELGYQNKEIQKILKK